MNYTLVFDVAGSGHSNWSGVATGLLCVGVGAFLVWKRRKLPTMFPGGMGPKAASAFACILGFFSSLDRRDAHLDLEQSLNAPSALQRGNAQVVEGRVEEFKPMPPAGHAQVERACGCVSLTCATRSRTWATRLRDSKSRRKILGSRPSAPPLPFAAERQYRWADRWTQGK